MILEVVSWTSLDWHSMQWQMQLTPSMSIIGGGQASKNKRMEEEEENIYRYNLNK